MSVILGINAFHAGSSACLVIDGIPIHAVAEERLNRKKYYAGFPTLAIKSCLDNAGLKISDIEYVEKLIIENREYSIAHLDEIREYAFSQVFSLFPKALKTISNGSIIKKQTSLS